MPGRAGRRWQPCQRLNLAPHRHTGLLTYRELVKQPRIGTQQTITKLSKKKQWCIFAFPSVTQVFPGRTLDVSNRLVESGPPES